MIRTDAIDGTTVIYPTPAGTAPAVKLGRLLGFLLPATTAMYALFQGLLQILVPAQVAAIDPVHKVGNLAMLTAMGAVATLVALPTGGAVSDRTRSRFGRRTPWLVASSVVAGVLMIATSYAGSVATLAAGYVLLAFVMNFYAGALNAILPDRIPAQRRGWSSAVIGLGAPLGILVGVNVASRAGQFWGYAIIGLIVVVATLALVWGAPEGSAKTIPPIARIPGPRRPTGAVTAFFDAFRSHHFKFAFLSRFAIFLAYATVAGYLYYTLTDFVGVENIPGGNVAAGVGTLATINTISWVVVATFCGWLADKIDRRKLFVAVSAIGLGISMMIPVFWQTWTGLVIYSIVGGAAIGTYFAVDLALMSLVLPNKDQEGRDFAILAVATGMPQILSSVIAGALITYAGGYTALYVFGAICAAVGGLLCFAIRTIR
jgi:MFS family permease